jgi:antibiotic biosynthesis monooxygenase (ABM) superfamily enzyme
MALTFLNPLWQSRSLSVRMLFGNILSVALLTWLVMPAVSRLLGFWLSSTGRNWKTEALGTGTVAAGLALFVLVFRMIT